MATKWNTVQNGNETRRDEKWVKIEINRSGIDKEKIQNMDQSDGLAIIIEVKTETFSSCSTLSEGWRTRKSKTEFLTEYRGLLVCTCSYYRGPGSNPGPQTGYTDWGFSWFSSDSLGNAGIIP